MLCLPGAAALSELRLGKLRERLESRAPGGEEIEAFHLHFVATRRDLMAEEQAWLKTLLEYGEGEPVADLADISLVVTPRPGTVSLWSSKATESPESE